MTQEHPHRPSGEARSSAKQAAETGRELKDQAVAQARAGAEKLREEAGARSRAVVDEQARSAAGVAHDLADALEGSVRHLRDRGHPGTARAVEVASEGVGRLARSLDGRDAGGLAGDLRRFGQDNPGLLLAGAVALGFVAARFFKSSGQHDARAGSPEDARQGAWPGPAGAPEAGPRDDGPAGGI